MGEWPRERLGEVLEAIIDHRGKTPKKLDADWSDSGHRVISAINIKNGRVDENDHHYIDDATYARWMRVPLVAGDVILTSEAPMGQVAFVSCTPGWALGQRVFGIRTRTDKMLGKFLYYYLQTAPAQSLLESRSSGTTVVGIKQKELVEVEVPVPSLNYQHQISRLLGALDEKFATNMDILRRSRDLMYWIYRSKNNDTISVPLDSLAKFVNGGAYTNGATGAGRAVIRIADLKSGISTSTVYNDIEVPEDRLALPGDILMSWSGSLGVYRWFMDEAIVNQHIFKVIPAGANPAWFVFHAVEDKLDDFKQIAADKATTMGHIRRQDLRSPVTVPSAANRGAVHAEMQALWDVTLKLRRENEALLALRSALLPGLMDGTLTVRAAKDLVSDSI